MFVCSEKNVTADLPSENASCLTGMVLYVERQDILNYLQLSSVACLFWICEVLKLDNQHFKQVGNHGRTNLLPLVTQEEGYNKGDTNVNNIVLNVPVCLTHKYIPNRLEKNFM